MATIDARVRNRLSKCLATKLSLLKLSLDVRIALGSLECIDAVLKLRKRYRLYPSWLVGWPIFDARLSGGRGLNAFCCDRSDESLLDGRKTSQAGW